jgi:hypothetical protein
VFRFFAINLIQEKLEKGANLMKKEPFKPQLGEMYRCESCQFEIHVTASCDCKNGCVSLICCGKPLTNVTEIPTQEAQVVEVAD